MESKLKEKKMLIEDSPLTEVEVEIGHFYTQKAKSHRFTVYMNMLKPNDYGLETKDLFKKVEFLEECKGPGGRLLEEVETAKTHGKLKPLPEAVDEEVSYTRVKDHCNPFNQIIRP